MRTDRAVLVPLMIGASVLLLGVAIYAPVLVAWNDRRERKERTLVVVTSSWPMRQLSFLYVPLTKFHATMCGYDYIEARSYGEVMVFFRST